MKTLIVGFGEIGKAMFKIIEPYHSVWAWDFGYLGYIGPVGIDFDVMLITFPYSDDFIDQVKNYQKVYRPKHTVIVSTVAIGTSTALGAVHSPVEGKHPHLAESIRECVRWIGGQNKVVEDFFKLANLKVKVFEKPEHTEFLKLFSTSLYGVNIQFMRYGAEVADAIGMPFECINEFNAEYNRLYKALGYPQYSRYLLTRPTGEIGGHCLTSNAKILDEQFPNDMLKEIYESSDLHSHS